jgi:hypothetical protein
MSYIFIVGCWIESALMRFLLFGCPVAIILLINFVFYTLTVRSIRRGLKKGKRIEFIFIQSSFFLLIVRIQVERKFQRKKQVIPGEHDVKIYMRMAVLAGFGWTIGFILFLLPDGDHGFKLYLVAIFKYLFILLNATPGLFIFVVYVCNRRVFALYCRLFTTIYTSIRLNILQLIEFLSIHCRNCFNRTKTQLEKFHQIQKQDIIPMDTYPKITMFKPLELSNQKTYTYFISGQINSMNKTSDSFSE